MSATSAPPLGVSYRRVAGAVLFAVGAAFLTGIMLAASMAPGYDSNGGAISDLGVVDETAALFNALLVGVGLLNVVGGYLLFRWHGRAWVLVPFILAGVGAAGAGLIPLDSGDAHSLFALLGFVSFNLEAISVAVVVSGPMRWLSVLAGGIGLVYVAVMIVGDSGNPSVFGAIGHGGAERMIVYPVMLWIIALGGWLIGSSDPRG